MIGEREKDLSSHKDILKNLENTISSQKTLIAKLEQDLMRSEGKPSIIVSPDQHQGAESSMLEIVSEQRNRFRKRLNEVEEENQNLKTTIDELKIERDKLKSDNVKMYEKIRYLENYRGNAVFRTVIIFFIIIKTIIANS